MILLPLAGRAIGIVILVLGPLAFCIGAIGIGELSGGEKMLNRWHWALGQWHWAIWVFGPLPLIDSSTPSSIHTDRPTTELEVPL